MSEFYDNSSELDESLDSSNGSDLTEAEKAADYARSYGFDKAADYIERHYDGSEFRAGNPAAAGQFHFPGRTAGSQL